MLFGDKNMLLVFRVVFMGIKNPIKAIVFDADGVIVRPKTWFFVPAKQKYGIPKKVFLEFIHGDFQRCTTGGLELLDVLPPLLEKWGV